MKQSDSDAPTASQQLSACQAEWSCASGDPVSFGKISGLAVLFQFFTSQECVIIGAPQTPRGMLGQNLFVKILF